MTSTKIIFAKTYNTILYVVVICGLLFKVKMYCYNTNPSTNDDGINNRPRANTIYNYVGGSDVYSKQYTRNPSDFRPFYPRRICRFRPHCLSGYCGYNNILCVRPIWCWKIKRLINRFMQLIYIILYLCKITARNMRDKRK